MTDVALEELAHPRSRGENERADLRDDRQQGSSPLTRGKLLEIPGKGHFFGLIPAHAGKTRFSRLSARETEAHPRSRGENDVGRSCHVPPAGSSPLTRGKPGDRAADRLPGGLIPAHAGKTATPNAVSCGSTAHPRSRGENEDRGLVVDDLGGSSPLTRGKPQTLKYRAGGVEAHPRSRGENRSAVARSMACAGSSPLTRGKPDRTAGPGQVLGLIPAHAGKTIPLIIDHRSIGAHPRSRGENWDTDRRYHKARGSSPLTRGKLLQRERQQGRHGLIPAHAGKTHSVGEAGGRLQAHPRSRGENLPLGGSAALPVGSSPLTRGKRPPLHPARPA